MPKSKVKKQSDKYVRQNLQSAARQQKYRDFMSEEKKEEYRRKARERCAKRKSENRVKLFLIQLLRVKIFIFCIILHDIMYHLCD